MERKKLESAAATYSYLRGLLSIPLGVLLIVAALGNWEWGPFRHALVFVASMLVAGAAWLAITRYYNEHYGRVTPSRTQELRGAVASVVAVGLMVGLSFLARSEADWSLDLPVNPAAAGIAVFMLVYYGIAVGMRAHHVVIWGAVLAAGLLPVWSGGDPSNIGLVLGGVAAIITGVLDHRLLVRTFGSPRGLNLENSDAGA